PDAAIPAFSGDDDALYALGAHGFHRLLDLGFEVLRAERHGHRGGESDDREQSCGHMGLRIDAHSITAGLCLNAHNGTRRRRFPGINADAPASCALYRMRHWERRFSLKCVNFPNVPSMVFAPCMRWPATTAAVRF